MTSRISCSAVSIVLILLPGCGSSSASRTVDANTSIVRTITTTFQGTREICALLSRDTSPCESARTNLGLSGNWLSFSCNVDESLATSALAATTDINSAAYVVLTSYSLPDYKSNYYPTTGSYSFSVNGSTVSGDFSSLYEAFSPPFPDPGSIAQGTLTMYVPFHPAAAGSTQQMPMGAVGMAINGVPIYSALAANTDNIFAEAGSFDQCQGHPAGTQYHYHSEPYAISYDDNKLIGVIRDGFFVYGRKDNDGTYPGSVANIQTATSTSDIYKYGGHAGNDPISGSGTTFHYHLTEWIGCYHETNGTKSSDDGSVNDTLNTPTQLCSSGTPVDGWFLTGRGNGGVFATVPLGIGTQSPAQSVAGKRYYYGTPGSCTGCTP